MSPVAALLARGRWRRIWPGVAAAVAAALLAVALHSAPSHAAASAFSFSSGNPDGKMAMATRPDSSGKPEIEAADDFVLGAQTSITQASFTGLMPAGVGVQSIDLEIYRVFPLDSNTSRTPRVPTRTNSPSDVDLQERSGGQLSFAKSILRSSFTASNSVLNGIHPAPGQTTGGDGPVTGQEVRFDVWLGSPFQLPAGHYFFVPQVQLAGSANFYWLSAPHPVASPGTPFSPDLQAWIRNSALEPDWLRVGTDIVGGNPAPQFNATFTLSNQTLPTSIFQLTNGIGVRLAVKAPAAGKITVRDPEQTHSVPWFKTVSVRATHRGTVHLRVVPNAAGRKHVPRRGKLKLPIEIVFTPAHGVSATRFIKISWHRK